jgi:hypothetical protein
MPRRHVSAQRLIACVPRRRPPPPACPAWSFAYIGTLQPAVGQTLGRAAQIQRLPTPSRALCPQTHQTRPYPRNHRYGRVRTWSRLQSGRTVTGKLAFHAHPPTTGAAGRHSLTCVGRERDCSHRGGPAPEARGRRGAPAAERAWPVLSVAVRQPIPTLAGVCAWHVAWVQCAAYTPLGMYHSAPWRAIHPPTPGGRYSSPEPPRLATDARCGLVAQPLRTDSQPPEIRLSTY